MKNVKKRKTWTYTCEYCGATYTRADNLSFHYPFCNGKKSKK